MCCYIGNNAALRAKKICIATCTHTFQHIKNSISPDQVFTKMRCCIPKRKAKISPSPVNDRTPIVTAEYNVDTQHPNGVSTITVRKASNAQAKNAAGEDPKTKFEA